jgi:hypothetical protein
MRRHVAFLLFFCLYAWPALADQTINQLSKGATLQGSETIPMFQGTNPAVTTTPQAIMNFYNSRTNTIDPTTMTGADICAKISAAAIKLAASSPGGGTIDARGFTGTLHCAGSMFANWPAQPFWATILLGYVNIQTDVAQQIPLRVWLRGTLAYSDVAASSVQGGSSIQASDVFPPNTPVVSIGPCCSIVAGPSGAFQVQIDHLAIGCETPSGTIPSGSIGLQNLNGQEGTEVHNLSIRGCFTGLQIAGDGSDGNLYSNLAISDLGIGSTSSPNAFVCIQIGRPIDANSDTGGGVAEISDVACGGNSSPTNMVLVDGWGWELRHIRFEIDGGSGGEAGINIGSQTTNIGTHNIIVDDFECAGVVGLASGGSCVKLSSGTVENVNLFNIIGGQSGAYLLNDTVAGGCIIPAANASALGFYSRGTSGRIETTASECHGGTYAASSPAVSSCGSGAGLSQGNDFGGYINPGSGTVTSCVLTFAQAFANPPNCVATALNSSTAPVAAAIYARSTNSITISTASTVASGQIDYQCSQE